MDAAPVVTFTLPLAPEGRSRIGTDRTRARSAASAAPLTRESEASLHAASFASESGPPPGPVTGQRLLSSSTLGRNTAPRPTDQLSSPAASVLPVTSTRPSRSTSARRSARAAGPAAQTGEGGTARAVPTAARTKITGPAGLLRIRRCERTARSSSSWGVCTMQEMKKRLSVHCTDTKTHGRRIRRPQLGSGPHAGAAPGRVAGLRTLTARKRVPASGSARPVRRLSPSPPACMCIEDTQAGKRFL